MGRAKKQSNEIVSIKSTLVSGETCSLEGVDIGKITDMYWCQWET